MRNNSAVMVQFRALFRLGFYPKSDIACLCSTDSQDEVHTTTRALLMLDMLFGMSFSVYHEDTGTWFRAFYADASTRSAHAQTSRFVSYGITQ